MGRLRQFYGSMVGKKVVMGVTGLIGIGFVILHSLGNLLVFRGPAALNSYSHFLKSSGELLWALRTLLIVAMILHILHFTTGTIRPAGVFTPGDVYANVALSFRIWWVSLFYVASMIALGFHLFHGAWSSVRSIGVSPESPHPLRHRISLVLAILI